MRIRYSIRLLMVLFFLITLPVARWADHNRMQHRCDLLVNELRKTKLEVSKANKQISILQSPKGRIIPLTSIARTSQ